MLVFYCVAVALVVGVYSDEQADKKKALQERLDNAEDLLESYVMQMSEQALQIYAQVETIHTLRDAHKEHKRAYTPVGFSAFAITQREYNQGETVNFPAVITNIGNAYDPGPPESVFTCPYPGLYLFSVTLFAEFDDHVSANLIRNNEPLIQAWTADTIQSDQATHLVVAEFQQGDRVFVQVQVPGILEGFPDYTLTVTTFTGVLIELI